MPLDRAEAHLARGVDAPSKPLRVPEQMDAACQRFAHRIPKAAGQIWSRVVNLRKSAQELHLKRGFCIAIFSQAAARAVA
jgi:hypothetical protein